MYSEAETRIKTRRLLEDYGIYSQADFKPGMMFVTGDKGILVIDSVQMIKDACPSKRPYPYHNRRYIVYTKYFRNRERETKRTQASNLYNKAIKMVLIK
jgi:hypothetical protein